MSTIRRPDNPSQPPSSLERRLDEILQLLRRIDRREDREAQRRDEYRAVKLEAKYPYGKPTDRWGRGR